MLENYSTPAKNSWLTWFFRGLVTLFIIVIFARLIEVQIIKGEYYENLADGNRARRVAIKAPRGNILAEGGEQITQNLEVKKQAKFDPLEGYEKVDATEDTAEEDIIIEWTREYPLGSVAGHITGYLGEVNAEELGKVNQSCTNKGVLTLGSFIGRAGLESQYDCQLRGIDGSEIVEVDTRGKKIRTLGRVNPIAGEDIKTHIDFKIQKKVAEAMTGKIGAVVVSKPTGEIKALFSSPSYDPSDISAALKDKDLPLFNRALGGVYHPGSIYKIVTSVAAIEDNAIEADFEYEDTGIIRIDEYEYRNWYFTQYGGQEGFVDVIKAMARSTDTFYYKIGEMLGVENLVKWSEKFGLKDRTGIDLPGETVGLVPSPEWKKAVKGERWYLGNTYHLSIGQGDLTSTPIATHRLSAVMASGGKLCNLFLNQSISSTCTDLKIDQQTFEVVKLGMKAACDPGGTGVPFFEFPVEVGCKTGTAETFEEDVTHAWFTVFAPYDNPEYVVTVLIEKGGEGSKVAAPVAREILDFIYNP